MSNILTLNGNVLVASGKAITNDRLLQSKTVVPVANQSKNFVPDSGYDGFTDFTVNASGFIVPSGTKSITSNGTVDVTNFASASVSVSAQPTIAVATSTPSSNSLSIEFSVSAKPKTFSCQAGAQITLGTTRYVMGVHSDGTNTYGIYGYRSGSSAYCYYSASYFTWSYSSGTLTITANSSSNGGYFRSGTSYRLIYAY